MKALHTFSLILIIGLAGFATAEKKRRPVPVLPTKASLEIPYSEKKLTRVDPHGSKDNKPTSEQAKQMNECQVCHTFQGTEFKTRPTALASCFNCHNRAPHSGVVEHLKHKVSCTDCHTLHRGSSVESNPRSGVFKNIREHNIESGLVEKDAKSAMLKKTCIECHKQ